MPKVAVILAGCGRMDGSEIHESVITLLALDRAGAQVEMFAPNVDQYEVVNHLTNETVQETRNVLVEAARIARGAVKDIKQANIQDYDAIVFPGGNGMAKNLFTFAVDGPECSVNEDIENFIVEGLKLKKPFGFICIAPVLLAKVASKAGINPKLTIGTDEGVAQAVNNMGACHENCPAQEFVVDEENKLVTTPAYMLGQSISEVADGIEKLCQEVIRLC